MKQEELFEQRLKEHYDELKWLYCELYGSIDMFYRLCRTMKDFFVRRKDSLKQLDRITERYLWIHTGLQSRALSVYRALQAP